MNINFQAKKDRSFGLFLLCAGLLIIFSAYVLPGLTGYVYESNELFITTLILLPVFALFVSIWLGTRYEINDETLRIKFGPFSRNIQIADISKIRLNHKTIGGTWKLTLSWKCMEIKYGKYKSIFITPQNQDEFISELVEINHNIIIK